MNITRIYVGSNNETGFLEMDIIKDVLNHWLSNYTIIMAKGCYEGKNEDTAIIEIMGDYNTGIVPILKEKLKQESIMVVKSYQDVKFI